MSTASSLFMLALWLPLAAPNKPIGNGSANDFAEGAISVLVSMRCQHSNPNDKSVEWTGAIYAAGKQPAWGRKPVGPCLGMGTDVLAEALGGGAFWNVSDRKALEADPMNTILEQEQRHAAFKKLFGWELFNHEELSPNEFPRYDARKLSKLFDRLYLPPTARIGHLTGQEVYDFFFKDFLTRFAREAALIKSRVPKAQLPRLLRAYQAAAIREGRKFQGPEYLKQVTAGLLPGDEQQAARASRTLGTMLRRTADGSWPTVTRMLKRILKDYDPELSKELGSQL